MLFFFLSPKNFLSYFRKVFVAIVYIFCGLKSLKKKTGKRTKKKQTTINYIVLYKKKIGRKTAKEIEEYPFLVADGALRLNFFS